MVKTKREPDSMGGPPYEKCCGCGVPTPFWYVEKDVPLCEKCSELMDHEAVPTKEEWFLMVD